MFIISAIALGLLLMSNSGCEQVVNEEKTEQQLVKANAKRLSASVEMPRLENSLDKINVKKRLELFDSPNKISYIYLISYGRVMANYVIKGKVTSGNKRFTAREKIYNARDYKDLVIESPGLDGTYVQWNGEYMLCDMPLKMSTQPELVRTVK